MSGSKFYTNSASYDVELVPPLDFRPKNVPPIANARPSPPRWLKYQVYTNPEVFASVDDHAIKVACREYDSFNALIYNLIYSKNFSQLERLRLIYRWLTVRNLHTIAFKQTQEAYENGGLPIGCPEDIIVGFRHRRSTYSKIFELMCLAAGIPCTLVTGVAKGIEYRPGVRVAQYRTGSPIEKEQEYNHSWNAVFIENSWQLIDVQWGTRFLQTSGDASREINQNDQLVYEYYDFYFMPDPSHLVYSHYPDDERWQLMPNPVPFEVFQSLPLAKPHFFLAELQFWSHNTGVIVSHNGCLKISIGFWKPVGFTYKIWDADTLSQETPNSGIPLHRFTLQEIGDGIVNYYIKLPYAGSFYFSVFAQRLDEMDIGQPAIYNAACEYKIIAERPATSSHGLVAAYPDIDSTYGYGSSLYYYQYGLVPSFKAGVLQASPVSNDFELTFAKTKEPRMHFRLRPLNDDSQSVELPIDVRDTSQLAKVVGRLPNQGEYVLEVYANDPENDGNQYTHIGQYMIVAGLVDLPEFQTGNRNASPAGFARYPDSFELQSTKNSSRLVYQPSSAANSLPIHRGISHKNITAPKTALKPPKEVPVSSSICGGQSGVTLSIGQKTNNGTNGAAVSDWPAPPPDWSSNNNSNNNNDNSSNNNKNGVFTQPLRQQQKWANSGSAAAPAGRSPPTAPKPFRTASPGPSGQQAQKTKQLFPPATVITFGEPSATESAPKATVSSSSGTDSIVIPVKAQNKTEGSPARGSPVPIVPQQQQQQQQNQWKKSSSSSPKQQQEPSDQSKKQQVSFDLPSNRNGQSASNQQRQSPLAQQRASEPTGPSSGLKRRQSYVYRTDNFAITSNYQRQANAPAMAPPQFEVARNKPNAPPPPPPGPQVSNAVSEAPAHLINEELEQYDEHVRVFSNVDRHAFEVARVQHTSFRDLVWDLIYAHNINDDLEKARALFLWLCTKDLSTMSFKQTTPGSPEEALMGLKSGTQTYAAVFEMLCSFAGLHCVTVSGFAKGVDYQPGMHFEGKEALHSWNAVLVAGQWRLVDTHWAARRMVGRRSIDNLRYELDEFFFLTSPRQLIYTHFPHDPSWQLLENRLSLSEFECLPPVKSLFFKLCLRFMADAGQAVLPAPHGERIVQLAFNDADAASLDFNYALATDDGRDEVIATGDSTPVKLNRFVLHEVVPTNTASFSVRLPSAGSYRIVVFASPKVNDDQSASFVDRMDRAYSAVCEWKIQATRPATITAPYPSCSAQRWGPPIAALAEIRGVSKLPRDARLYTDSQGVVEIVLKKTDPKQQIIFAAKLRAFGGYDEAVLDTSILHRQVGNDLAIFTISAPGRGEFGVDIFSTRTDAEENSSDKSGQRTLFHLCQYLIICEEPTVSGLRFPAMPAGYLGPQRAFGEMGLSTLSHSDPFINVRNMKTPLEVVFGLPSNKALRAVTSLIRLSAPAPGASTEDFSEWVLHQSPLSGDRIAFVCRFPKPGMYKLQVFAQPVVASGAAADSIPGVYNYLVDVGRDEARSSLRLSNADDVQPFPKQYSQWHEGGFLVEPLDGILARNSLPGGMPNRLLVRLAIPRARKVAAVVADTWTHLTCGEDGIWEGVVVLDKVWSNPNARKLSLSANFLPDSPSAYATLLEFKLRT